MENNWLHYAKRLQALARTGLTYSTNQYDLERFREIDVIAQEMLSQLFDAPIQQVAQLAPDIDAYPTPRIDVRGAVIEGDHILLVKEGVTGRWTLPGGFADIGYSAAENVVKEVSEEACIEVVAKRLYCLRHKSKGPFDPDLRDFYKLYFLCERVGNESPKPGPEVSDVGFFSLEALPELCTQRIVKEDLIRAFQFHRYPDSPAWFD